MVPFILECISSSVSDTDHGLFADLDSISWDAIRPENNYPLQGSLSNFYSIYQSFRLFQLLCFFCRWCYRKIFSSEMVPKHSLLMMAHVIDVSTT